MSSKVSKGRLIPAAILAILVYGMIAAMLGTLLPQLGKRFALSGGQMGQIALAQAIGLIIASISSGPLVDNKGKKVALLLGLGLIALALFALPSAAGYGMLLALFLVLGVGGGIIVTAANALVSDISEERRATTLNLLNLFFGLGGLLTPAIAGYVLADNTIALCYLVAALTAVTLLVHGTTAMPAPTGERSFKMEEAGKLLGTPKLYLLSLLLFLYVACEVGVWNWLTSYLTNVQKLPEADAAKILSLGFALGILIGRVVVSRILINVKPVNVTLVSAALMAVFTFAMLQTGHGVAVAALVFCAGCAMAPVFPTTLAMVGNAFPRMTATAMGITITSGWIGLAVSSYIIGAVAGAGREHLDSALLVIPAASVIMIAVNLALRPMLAPKAATAGR